jgi:ATP-dependent Clp protease, protease subunit
MAHPCLVTAGNIVSTDLFATVWPPAALAQEITPTMARRDAPQPESEQPDEERGPLEIAIVGDLTDSEGELTNQILGVAPGGECTIYFDSPGGSPYCAMSLVSLLRLRDVRATAIVTGECSSAALWPFATCRRRIVTPYSVFLFHPMKWQSEEHIGIREAAEWSRHFAELEREMDVLLCQLFGRSADLINEWIRTHRYVTGKEMAGAGLAELVGLDPLPALAGRD